MAATACISCCNIQHSKVVSRQSFSSEVSYPAASKCTFRAVVHSQAVGARSLSKLDAGSLDSVFWLALTQNLLRIPAARLVPRSKAVIRSLIAMR